MEKITSFTVDHTVLDTGIYVSRTDGDIVTYDLRMKKPNTDEHLSVSAMHSLEHMLATYLRNSVIADKIIYVGPMGCQTGFYVLVRMNDNKKFLKVLKKALKDVCDHDGGIFGNSPVECGNYKTLSLGAAKKEASKYLEILNSKEHSFYY